MVIIVYHYFNCGICKKARKWFDVHRIEYVLIDIVKEFLSKVELTWLWKLFGVEVWKLLNISGESYSVGNFKAKLETMSDVEVLAVLAADGKLIKCLLIDGGDFVLVGFDERRYVECLG